MTIEVFNYTMGFKVFLRGEREAFSSAVESLQSSIPYALRTFINTHWHVEKRAERYLRQWSEKMKLTGATVQWREQESESDLRSKLFASAKKKEARKSAA